MRTFIVLLFLSLSGVAVAQNADINLLKAINTNRNTSLDPTFRLLSNTDGALCYGIPALLITRGLIIRDSVSLRKALVVASSGAAASIITTIVKYSVNRRRPYEDYPFIEKASSGGSPSFPSGHTSSAFALATSLSLNYPKWYIIVPSYVWAGSVGYSRMHLGVHYPSDVLAGALIGSGSAWLTWKLNKLVFQK